ncbi:MAG: DUF2905 domain-containing protein [Synergistetes bacterium]|nr:DUF2905 domain-containing protein [Synergistota bacterium]MCX8127205.1 DUF2905 domain-containing protein [Synergistota bacterium]MDW8191909.1 DUF2905 domain-containing protein [Synergistota bacterium]
MESLGKILIIFGLIIVITGLVLTFAPKIPYIGKLPGDIYVERKGMVIYFPIVTSLVLSLVLTLLLNLIFRR